MVVSDGVELHVRVDGAGPDLVLVNGAFCSLRQWDGVIDALASRHRVIRLDVRGTGRSGAGPADGYTFERYADDIAEIAATVGADSFATVGADSFSLWGLAWGARVALVAAARHAARVDRLVLSDFAVDPADLDAQLRGMQTAKEARAAQGIEEVAPPAG